MQVNVHDRRLVQKSGFWRNVCFTVTVAKFSCSLFSFRKGDLKMSQQCNLPESMACHIIGRLEEAKIQLSVADTIRVAWNVIAREWNRFQKTRNVRSWPEHSRERTTTAIDDRYILLTARRDTIGNANQLQRHLLLATGRKVSSQTLGNRRHQCGLYKRSQRSVFCWPQVTVLPEKGGCWTSKLEAMSLELSSVYILVWSVSPDVFW